MKAVMMGVKPEFYTALRFGEVMANESAISEAVRQQRENGATYFRVTRDDARMQFWVEGWAERPDREAPFDPPVTYA